MVFEYLMQEETVNIIQYIMSLDLMMYIKFCYSNTIKMRKSDITNILYVIIILMPSVYCTLRARLMLILLWTVEMTVVTTEDSFVYSH